MPSFGNNNGVFQEAIDIPDGRYLVRGNLRIPPDAQGVVLFAHGSGSGRHSPRNRYVAQVLEEAGLATSLVDLLEESEAIDRNKVFDIPLLARRVGCVMDWLSGNPRAKSLALGLFGASTGAAAALLAAARKPDRVEAVVSRGGRPDLVLDVLDQVTAPTLLIVGGSDTPVIEWNKQALQRLRCPAEMTVIPGASHLFSEEGALENVAELARDWFLQHLSPGTDHSFIEERGGKSVPGIRPVA